MYFFSVTTPNDTFPCNLELCSSCLNDTEDLKCEKDFELWEETCIWVNVFPRNHTQAIMNCQERSAELLQIDWSARELLGQFLQQKCKNLFFLSSSQVNLSKKVQIYYRNIYLFKG